jgi:hypothetical protein
MIMELPIQKERRNRKKITLLLLGFCMVMTLVLGLAMTVIAQPTSFPDVIELPDGFQPEGITLGRGTMAYVGSIPTGAVYQINLRTGA